MMRWLAIPLICLSFGAWAQSTPGFVDGSVLTAEELNSGFANKANTSNGTLTSPTITGGSITNAALTGGSINGWNVALTSSWASAGAPATGGSGYAVNDLITLTSGTIVSVNSVSSGAVTGFVVSTPATLSTPVTEPETQVSTTGSGTSATFNIQYLLPSQGTTFEPFINGTANGITRVGYRAGWGLKNTQLGPSCFGYESCGAGGNTLDGQGGGTGMASTENTGIGGLSLSQMTTGYWITATGWNAAGHEVDGHQSDYYGSGSGKYALHNNYFTGFGYDTAKFLWNTNHVAIQGSGALTGAFNAANISVTGAANNGSGLIRLTVSTTAAMTTLDAVFVGNIVGTTEANTTGTPWYITVIDGTHIDLIGSTFTNAYVSGGYVNDFISGFTNNAVTGAANNGSGLVRLTVGNTVGIPCCTGTVFVAGVGGTTEANGTWTYNLVDANCEGGGCRIDLTGSTFVHAYTSGGRETVLSGPNSVAIMGDSAANNAAMTGGIFGVTDFGAQSLQAMKILQFTTVAGFNVGPTNLGSTGNNQYDILIGVNGEDVTGPNVQNAVGICMQCKLATNSVQIGYRSTFLGNLTSSATNIVTVGDNTGFSLVAPVQVSAFGQNVASSTCTSPTNVLLLGTDNNTDCTSATESNVIHIGAGGGDIFRATGTGTPSTALTTITGNVSLNAASGLTLSTTNGFVALPFTAGIPTGAPTQNTNCAIDTSNGYLNCYWTGAWHKIQFSSGAG